MSYSSISSSVGVGKPVPASLLQQISDDLDYLNGQIGTIGVADIPNGSFEIDSNSDGTPDNWTFTPYTGGSGAIDSTVPAHGANCVTCIHPGGVGNGGGIWESDYVPCDELAMRTLSFISWAGAPGMKNQALVRFFDKGKVEVGGSPITLWTSTSNPASATVVRKAFVAPFSARFMKVKLIGGNSDTNVMGTAYFDGVQILNSASQSACPFTLAETTGTVTNAYANMTGAGGGQVNIYIPRGVHSVYVNGQHHGSVGPDTWYTRWNISGTSVYSTEQSTGSTTYVACTHRLDVSAYQEQYITIKIQGKNASGGANMAYYQKTEIQYSYFDTI